MMHGYKSTPGSKLQSIFKLKVTKYYRASRVQSKVYKEDSKMPAVYDGRMELDSHGDTFVTGRNCLLLQYSEQICDLMPYTDDYEAKTTVAFGQIATGYTTANGKRFILIVNEAIVMPELENSLANPNQFCDFGIEVQDNPYSKDPMTIRCPEQPFVDCLKSMGTTIFVDTWTPTQTDLDDFPHVVLTSPSPWNPEDVKFPGLSNLEIEKI